MTFIAFRPTILIFGKMITGKPYIPIIVTWTITKIYVSQTLTLRMKVTKATAPPSIYEFNVINFR